MDIPPTGGRDDRNGTVGGRDPRILPPEQNFTVYCDQAHYGPVFGGGSDTGAKDIQAVVVTVMVRCRRHVDGSSGGGTGGGGGGGGGDTDGLAWVRIT